MTPTSRTVKCSSLIAWVGCGGEAASHRRRTERFPQFDLDARRIEEPGEAAIGFVLAAEGLRAIWPYMASLILGLILVAAVPWISIGFLG